jgi:RimJ/RimL family protein N-acetyltransferase
MINLREIVVNDYQVFNELYKAIEAESDFMLYEKDERKTTDNQQKVFLEKLASDSSSTIVLAEVDCRIVGFIGIINEGPNKKKFSRYVAMGLLNDFHGKKIGSLLMESCVEFCRKQNVKRIELTVVKDNQKAVNLYKKFGFEIEGIKKNSLYINDTFIDEYFMARTI